MCEECNQDPLPNIKNKHYTHVDVFANLLENPMIRFYRVAVVTVRKNTWPRAQVC